MTCLGRPGAVFLKFRGSVFFRPGILFHGAGVGPVLGSVFGPVLLTSYHVDTVSGVSIEPHFFRKSDVSDAPETCFWGVAEHVGGGGSDLFLTMVFNMPCIPRDTLFI